MLIIFLVGRKNIYKFQFDCQTILTSVGASVMENPQPGQEALDPSITYNISIKDDTKDVQGALEKATGQLGEESEKTQESPIGWDVKGRAENSDSLIDLNTNVTMKAFIRKIDEYLLEQGHAGLPSKNTIKTEDLANSGEGFKRSGGSGNYKYFIYMIILIKNYHLKYIEKKMFIIVIYGVYGMLKC